MFAYHISDLTPLPATLTGNRQFPAKTAPVTPLDAVLTKRPFRNSFPCHSYAKQEGGRAALSISVFSKLEPQLSGFSLSTLNFQLLTGLPPKLNTANCKLKTGVYPDLRGAVAHTPPSIFPATIFRISSPGASNV
jgi:hypothetical protein